MARARYSDNRDFYLALGQRIAKARATKITQEALAKKLSLTRTSIINIEKGRQQVLVHTLADVARVLGVSIDDLMPAQNEISMMLRDTPSKGREWILNSVTPMATDKK
jgi:transcriptional regulator with XRE-family HTH domain